MKRNESFFPRIRIAESAWKRMRAYIEACPTEIAGMGLVEIRPDELLVTDVFLIAQQASLNEADLDPEGLAMLQMELSAKGTPLSKLKFWWHSHAGGPCYWSQKDLNTMDALSEGGYTIAYVGNHAGDSRLRVCAGKPFRLAFDDLRLDIVPKIDFALRETVRSEIAEKVRPMPEPAMRPLGLIAQILGSMTTERDQELAEGEEE